MNPNDAVSYLMNLATNQMFCVILGCILRVAIHILFDNWLLDLFDWNLIIFKYKFFIGKFFCARK